MQINWIMQQCLHRASPQTQNACWLWTKRSELKSGEGTERLLTVRWGHLCDDTARARYKAGGRSTALPATPRPRPALARSRSVQRQSSQSWTRFGPSRWGLTFLDEDCVTPGPGTWRLLANILSLRTWGPWAPQLPRCGRGMLLLSAAGPASLPLRENWRRDDTIYAGRTGGREVSTHSPLAQQE